MGRSNTLPMTDPVVVYDVMLEAKTRLIAAFIAAGNADADIVRFAIEQDDRVAAIRLDDLEAQVALTEQFRTERDQLAR